MGHLLVRLEPSGGIEVEPLDQPRRAGPKLRWESGHHLELRSGHDRAESQLRGWPRQPGQEQRLGLVRGHPGEARPIAVDEADPAERTALSEDGHARGAQLLDVPVDGPDRDLELVGELRGGHATPTLEQQQEVHEPARAHRLRIRTMSTVSVRYDDARPDGHALQRLGLWPPLGPAFAQEALDLADQVVARWQALLIDHGLQAFDVRPRRLLERGRGVEPRPELTRLLGEVARRQRETQMSTQRLDERYRRRGIRPGDVVRDLREVADCRDAALGHRHLEDADRRGRHAQQAGRTRLDVAA